MQSSCRSCKMVSEYNGKPKHKLKNIKQYCLLCKKFVKSIIHNESDFKGTSYECNNCNNYIVYLDEDNIIVKDEFYRSNFSKGDFCLIRDHDEIFVLLGAKDIFHIENDESLNPIDILNKIENIINFL